MEEILYDTMTWSDVAEIAIATFDWHERKMFQFRFLVVCLPMIFYILYATQILADLQCLINSSKSSANNNKALCLILQSKSYLNSMNVNCDNTKCQSTNRNTPNEYMHCASSATRRCLVGNVHKGFVANANDFSQQQQKNQLSTVFCHEMTSQFDDSRKLNILSTCSIRAQTDTQDNHINLHTKTSL